MLVLKKAGVLVLVLSFTAAFSLSAPGRILFEDGFEADDVGDEPALWNPVPGSPVQVVEDPDDPDNKVLEQNWEANGLGCVTPAGWEDQDFWTDYVWEFDWMWNTDTYQGTAHRYQDAGGYYHSSRREGGGNFITYMWNGNFNQIQASPWQSGVGVWYRMQSSDIGNEHIIKGKERDDETPFEQLDPVISVEDDTYPEGPIGLFGGIGLYWDNIIVYEPGTDIHAVKPAEKLGVTWGELKAVY